MPATNSELSDYISNKNKIKPLFIQIPLKIPHPVKNELE